MTRFRVALAAMIVLIAVVVVVTVLRPATPPSVNGGASGSAVLPAGERTGAPDFTGIDAWINSPPLSLSGLHGKVALIDFWTFSCVNCVRTIPHLQHLYDAYRDRGFVIVGVHSPEFEFEKVLPNITAAVQRLGVTWPVAVDSEMATWNAYSNNVWPAEYLLDQQGRIAYVNLGEGNYDATDGAVASLLGVAALPGPTASALSGNTTPELYAGSERGQLADGASYGGMGQPTTYPDPGAPRTTDLIQVTGVWTDHGQYVEAGAPGHIRLSFHANSLYVVVGTAGGSRSVAVAVDGAPVAAAEAGPALNGGQLTVNHQDLYRVLVNLTAGYHLIDLTVPAGVQLYTFTFG